MDSLNWFNTYPYLVNNVVGLVFCILAYAIIRKPGNLALVGGLMSVPLLPFFLVFEGHYWSPVLLGGWWLGIEDPICLFNLGFMPCLLAALPFRSTLWPAFEFRQMLIRGFGFGSGATAVFLAFWLTGTDPITSNIAANSVMLILVLILRKDLWPIALCGVFIYGPFFCLWQKISFLLWPHFLSQWNQDNFWGVRYLGLPIGEIGYGFSLGSFYPAYVAYCCNVRLRSRSYEVSRSRGG